MWYLAIALIVIGGIILIFALNNVSYTAPQASDPGNKFIWPSIGLMALGAILLSYKIIMYLLALIHYLGTH